MRLSGHAIASFRVLAASTTIPSSASAPLQVTSSLADECSHIEIYNNTTKDLKLYQGPAGAETLLFYIPGMTAAMGNGFIACKLSKGMRLSIGAADAVDVTSLNVIISCWA